MARLLGFFSGIAIAIIVLAAVDEPIRDRAGVLATTLANTVLDAVNPSGSTHRVENLHSAALPPELRISEPGPREPAAAEAWQSSVEPPVGSAQTLPGDATVEEPVFGTVPQPEQQDTPMLSRSTSPADSNRPDAREWQPVWEAFRSEISAKGFARRLKRLTGQLYRVRRTSSWAYQVELAYADPLQRDAVLREIQTKTGLGLMETQP